MSEPRSIGDVRALAEQGQLVELAEILRVHPDHLVRYAAAEELGKGPSTTAENALMRAAREDRRAGVRARAARSLPGATTDSEIALRTLIEAIGDAEEAVRLAAVRALGDLRDRGAIPSLEELLRDPDYVARLSALSALVDFDSPTPARAIQVARKDRNLVLRVYAWGFAAAQRRVERKRRRKRRRARTL